MSVEDQDVILSAVEFLSSIDSWRWHRGSGWEKPPENAEAPALRDTYFVGDLSSG